MLIGHVVDSKLIYVTDLISPRGGPIARAPETIAVGNTLREFDVERYGPYFCRRPRRRRQTSRYRRRFSRELGARLTGPDGK